ncbi:MAG: adenylate/guanylate cyclase domain-containing protein [Pseudomonadota bacterium]
MKRRLSAILAADVVGYSRLMRADELGTFERVAHCLETIVMARIAARNGRVFKTMGDGILAEFVSVRLAVAAAVEIQEALAADPVADAGGLSPIKLRIGVTLGDVIAQGDDLYGDGVNMAARVEAIAPVGGVAVTRTVRDAVRDHLDLVFEDAGKKVVKNIPRPVHIFHVKRQTPGASAEEAPAASPSAAPAVTVAVAPEVAAAEHRPARRRLPLVPIAAAMALAALAGAALQREHPETEISLAALAPAGTAEAEVSAALPGTQDPGLLAASPSSSSAASAARLEPVSARDVDAPPARDTGTSALRLEDLVDGDALAALPWSPPTQDDDATGQLLRESIVPETVSVRISFSLNPGSWPSCEPFGGQDVHLLPIGADGGWHTIRNLDGHEIEMRARARPSADGEGLTISILPYPDTWRSADAMTVRFASRNPGAVREAYSERRAMPPLIGCGRLVAHVELVD